MSDIEVLIVDDSAIYRSQLRAAIAEMSFLKLIGSVQNGQLALDVIGQRNVDLVILDMEMPVLDGLATLRKMREKGFKGKIIFFSSHTQRGAALTIDALLSGANDFAAKPSENILSATRAPHQQIADILGPKIEALFNVGVPSDSEAEKSVTPQSVPKLSQMRCLCIGSSTGGPTVLEKIFTQVRSPMSVPVFIVQHMPPLFIEELAQRLRRISRLDVRVARNDEIVDAHGIYLAPGDFHMEIVRDGSVNRIKTHQGPLEHFIRPAVDPLLRSAAKVYGRDCCAMILTGMGSDGALGTAEVKNYGGKVIVQDKESCVVFGMPGAVKNMGTYDCFLNPDQMIHFMNGSELNLDRKGA